VFATINVHPDPLGIVVARVNRVGERVLELPEITSKGATVISPYTAQKIAYFPLPVSDGLGLVVYKCDSLEEQNMVGINRTDGLLQPVVECQQTSVLAVGRLI